MAELSSRRSNLPHITWNFKCFAWKCQRRRIISRGADVDWPPRSCDLTPMDFFLWLWGYLNILYTPTNLQRFERLKENMCQVTAQITAKSCEKVIENYHEGISTAAESPEVHTAYAWCNLKKINVKEQIFY